MGNGFIKKFIKARGEASGKPLLKDANNENKKITETVEKRGRSDDEKPENGDHGAPMAQRGGFTGVIRHVIEPDERTLRNYTSFNFWKQKRELYRNLREKEKQDINVFQVLSDGARPSIEYYILTVLSGIIATAGLIQGSTATIIGAMIVAPFMTPILAFSLGVIWGDFGLIRTSVTSLIKGIGIALMISASIAYVIPIPHFSAEIISRTHPTIFDIIVALASGVAGAYGNANSKISNTLVGIAIAVALMPPLCTIGIGLGKFDPDIAGGAAVLFIINLVSISLAGAVIFWLMKIHPVLTEETSIKKRAAYEIIISVMILTIIAVPVAVFMKEEYTRMNAINVADSLIKKKLPSLSIIEMKMEKLADGYICRFILSGKTEPTEEEINAIKMILFAKDRNIKNLQVQFIQSRDIGEP